MKYFSYCLCLKIYRFGNWRTSHLPYVDQSERSESRTDYRKTRKLELFCYSQPGLGFLCPAQFSPADSSSGLFWLKSKIFGLKEPKVPSCEPAPFCSTGTQSLLIQTVMSLMHDACLKQPKQMFAFPQSMSIHLPATLIVYQLFV